MPPKSATSICVVCGKPITGPDCFSMGSEGYRHKKGCGPGTKAWKTKYPTGNPEIRRLLEPKAKDGQSKALAKKDDPIRQAVKEFCGRIKYMMYMDIVNKNPVSWTVSATINGHELHFCCGDQPLDPEALYKELKG